MSTQTQLHLVTGGTGFVGSAIILELLRTTEARIIGLTRPAEIGARARLHETLKRVARLYGHGESFDERIAARVEAVAADLHEDGCGVEVSPSWAGAEFWHCAASLKFLDRHEREIMATNVEGSRHVVALAQAAGVSTLNMVSTAYVAGTRSGEIEEAPASLEHSGTNNLYERSKVSAEQLATASEGEGLRVRVLRPGIVVGHSKTKAALNYNGLYGFVRGLYKFRQLMERTQRELGDTLEVKMVADAEATLNFIPVDHVAHDAVAISRADAGPGFYHLTTSQPPPTRRSLEVMFDAVGMRAPQIVEQREEFSWLDEKFNARVDFYNAYFVGPKDFSRANTDRVVGASPSQDYVLDEGELGQYCSWYVEQVLAERKPAAVTR